MSKIVNISIDNCLGCPYCTKIERPSWVYHQCTLAGKKIAGGVKVTNTTPIPEWCPLPDGSEVKYFVVRSRVEDVTDDFGAEFIRINKVSAGDETYILLTFEKDREYKLAGDLNQLGEENVAVILGRIISEEEVDLDRGNTHLNRRGR